MYTQYAILPLYTADKAAPYTHYTFCPVTGKAEKFTLIQYTPFSYTSPYAPPPIQHRALGPRPSVPQPQPQQSYIPQPATLAPLTGKQVCTFEAWEEVMAAAEFVPHSALGIVACAAEAVCCFK